MEILLGLMMIAVVFAFLLLLLFILIASALAVVSIILFVTTGKNLEDWFFEWRMEKDDK